MGRSQIKLSGATLVASGSMRDCFVHPNDSSKCVKVDRPKTHKPATLIEAQYFAKIYRIRKDRPFGYISNCHGLIDTDLGQGAVYDLVRDETTGQVSDTLMNYLLGNDCQFSKVNTALDVLQEQLIADPIIIRDFRPWNICVQRMADDDITLKIIDGFGHKYFLPICDYVPFVARKVALKYWQRNSFDSAQALLEKFATDRSNKWQGSRDEERKRLEPA